MTRYGVGKIDSYTQSSGEVISVKLGSDNKEIIDNEVIINEEELLLEETNTDKEETIDKE